MLNFKPIKISDKKDFDKIVRPLNSLICSHSFTDLFIWKHNYNTEICFKDNFVFIKQNSDKKTIYTFPLGTGDYISAIKLIKEDANKNNTPLYIAGINEEQNKILSEIMPNEFEIVDRRDSEDYIYNSEDLISLSGKKFHSKRNFINRFKNTYKDRWSYEPITKKNIREVFYYHLSWCSLNLNNENEEIFNETCAISIALKNFDELELTGGLLRIDNIIIGFTLGSKAHEKMFIVHIEKADFDVTGSYQMINNQFAINNLKDIELVNREEDLGKEGLRKAKLSYNPIIMGKSLLAIPK